MSQEQRPGGTPEPNADSNAKIRAERRREVPEDGGPTAEHNSERTDGRELGQEAPREPQASLDAPSHAPLHAPRADDPSSQVQRKQGGLPDGSSHGSSDRTADRPADRPRVHGEHGGRNRRARLFEPTSTGSAFGAASISLLLDLLLERTRSNAWSIPRQRIHARSLLELAVDHYFSDEELAVLEAFVRES